MSRFRIQPHGRLQEWVAEERGYFRDEGLDYEFVSSYYGQTQGYGSQIGAAASNQSEVVADREVLEKRFAELEKQYEDSDVPTPAHWGGFRVKPETIEFWQGRRSRLHDRLRYRRDASGAWVIERVAP